MISHLIRNIGKKEIDSFLFNICVSNPTNRMVKEMN